MSNRSKPKTENEKLIRLLGADTVIEMESLSTDGLKSLIVQANQSMAQVKAELEANPAYQDLKLRLKDVTQSKREVDKRQRAKISLALTLLETSGATSNVYLGVQ